MPQDHILQKIEKAIDFGFMYEEVKDLQSGHRQTEYRPGMLSKAVHHKLSVRIQQYVPHNRRMEVNMAFGGSSVMTSPKKSRTSRRSGKIICIGSQERIYSRGSPSEYWKKRYRRDS